MPRKHGLWVIQVKNAYSEWTGSRYITEPFNFQESQFSNNFERAYIWNSRSDARMAKGAFSFAFPLLSFQVVQKG